MVLGPTVAVVEERCLGCQQQKSCLKIAEEVSLVSRALLNVGETL